MRDIAMGVVSVNELQQNFELMDVLWIMSGARDEFVYMRNYATLYLIGHPACALPVAATADDVVDAFVRLRDLTADQSLTMVDVTC